MGTNGAAKVTLSGGDAVEESGTTVEIKIKTLDSQTYTLRVNKFVPVPALKEQIATVTGVLSEQQRLICRGKLLKDDQLLSAYHVEDGHTLHLVVREPHPSSSPSTNFMATEDASASASGGARNRGSHVARSYVFETVNTDPGDNVDTSLLRFISSMLDSIGTTGNAAGSTTIGQREVGPPPNPSSGGSLSNSAQPQPNPTMRQGDMRSPPTVSLGPQNPAVIPDSLTTLSQYLVLMRDEFRREGFGADGGEHINNVESSGMQRSAGQHHGFRSHISSSQGGLPSPASLAEILLSARQLLMEQAGECQLHLARRLENHTSEMDILTRMNIQSSAIRYGVLMQKLGSLLLELGRTTMTLRMGQTPSEAVINAGPAIFISSSGPSPMMVQPAPFYPGSNAGGSQTGSVNSDRGVEGESDSVFLPRNVEIRIRTVGRAVPVAGANVGEQASAQQPQEQTEQTDPVRNSSAANVIHQAFSGISGGEAGVRVVPIRTVVAVPSGVNQSPSDSGSSVRLFYPMLARVRQPNNGNTNDARGSQAASQPQQGGPEVHLQPIFESTVQRQNSESNSGSALRDATMPFVSEMSPVANESSGYQGSPQVFISSQVGTSNTNSGRSNQADDGTARDIGLQEAAELGSEPVFFSNMLRQLMPLLSHRREPRVSPTNPSSSTAHTERENLNSSSSSQHHRDLPEAPSPKRSKRE